MKQILTLVARIGLTTIAGVVLGSIYIVRCDKFANTSDSLQACFAFGGSMMGVGAGINARKKGRNEGFLEGYETLNPHLRPPENEPPASPGIFRRK